ncbi:DUF4232 domain-containing protein [Streptomyces spirodelae]|uniref:DUF4232 domain-containing protein n=1 Tax=Streptomyces spirodelae TaxID=2812904 RepID=A0ABS3X0P6_9ACTN|nr:DUF4232 domain-containing protein [Streptomyces spirodelae]MBO8188904.1 DUF4232 domain-containing protein [Streptomyces spirodelae]
MKTIGRTIRSTGLAAVAAAAALSLTACQGDGGKDDDASSSSAAGAAKGTGAKDAASTGSDSGSTGDGDEQSNGGGGTQSNKAGSGGSGKPAQGDASGANGSVCTVGTVSVDLQETGGSAPVILLKATNNGSTRCDLYGHPFVGYPDAQSPIPIGGGKPQSVVSLEPGTSAYSALSLEKGNGGNMHREKQLTVQLADRSLHGTGATAKVAAPGEAGLALSDNSTVTYWNDTVEQVLQ